MRSRCSTTSASRAISRRASRRSASPDATSSSWPRRSPSQPQLLILDEPTAPLSQESVDLLFRVVRELAAQGTAVVYITHRLGEVREIADRVTVLRDGTPARHLRRRRHHGRRAARADHRPHARSRPSRRSTRPATTSAAARRSRGSSGHGFADISFAARRGEIVGIAGVVGNGQPALLRALAGLDGATRARSASAGTALTHGALLASSAYMPSDRHTEGLMMGLSVRENAALSALDRLKAWASSSAAGASSTLVERELSELAVKAPSSRRPSRRSPAATSRRS